MIKRWASPLWELPDGFWLSIWCIVDQTTSINGHRQEYFVLWIKQMQMRLFSRPGFDAEAAEVISLHLTDFR